MLDHRPCIWTHDRLAPYDARLIHALMEAAQRVGTALQPVAYNVNASDVSMVLAAGGTLRIACFGHVREKSHGYEVARLSVVDNVLAILLSFVTSRQG